MQSRGILTAATNNNHLLSHGCDAFAKRTVEVTRIEGIRGISCLKGRGMEEGRKLWGFPGTRKVSGAEEIYGMAEGTLGGTAKLLPRMALRRGSRRLTFAGPVVASVANEPRSISTGTGGEATKFERVRG